MVMIFFFFKAKVGMLYRYSWLGFGRVPFLSCPGRGRCLRHVPSPPVKVVDPIETGCAN